MVRQDDDEPESESESEVDSEEGQPIRRVDALADKSYLPGDEDVDEDEASVTHGTPNRLVSSHAAPISNQQLRNNILALKADEVVSSSRPNGSAPPASSLPAVHHRSISKRSVPRVESSVEEDVDDDPFETNAMLNKNNDQIAAKRNTIEQFNAKRPRLSKSPTATGPSRRSPPTTIPSRSRSGISDGEPDEHAVQEGLQPADLAILTQRAKANKGELRQHKARPPQKRVPWSDHDRLKLIKNIEKHGCSWSALEEIQGYEVWRSQQQIRDRARNEKVKTLEGRSLLWSGFDDVVLGYKEKQHLIKLGLNPDRKEDDFDVRQDGKKIPTNVFLEP
ncbi:hypothetical protein PG994_004784 [Apiospora phragmitis]|uniref:Myb-like domain-containing protein n=1 Tax=Apiospora phragmitis TaxID=2905665 RepID=A0ABR1VRK3_9PEZI